MPSKESDALRLHLEEFNAYLTAHPDLDLAAMRALGEGMHLRAAEPTDVTYEEAPGCPQAPGLWCKPLGAAADRVILYFHGGGFVTNSRHSHRKMVAHLAKATGCHALVLDYRLAPEHPYPAQLEDATQAYEWLLGQGIAPEHIATAGDSAGGNLATSVVLKLRDDDRPLPAAIVGFSPWYDMEGTAGTLDSAVATDPYIRREVVVNMAAAFLGPTAARTDPLANPLYADPTGLPPLYLSAGAWEGLRDNAERFADRAKNAGVEVQLEIPEGMQHVFQYMAGSAPEADQSIAEAGRFLRDRLGLA